MSCEPAPSTVNYRQTKRLNVKALLDYQSRTHRSASFGGFEYREEQPEKEERHVGTLNWKNGVFIPCLLNIWGVIMFLRLGWVVGQAGIIFAVIIIAFSNVVTTITGLSLCAICTNGEVKGGGVYYLISRALGPVFGGTIGILFFVAQAVATSLYVVGFAESITDLLQDQGLEPFTGNVLNDIRIIGIATSLILLIIAYIGIGWYAKCQIGLLFVLVIGMASTFIGAFFPSLPDEAENKESGFVGFGVRNVDENFQIDPALPEAKQNFFTVFAVFFPAVTGIMAGANLSGDLKDPSRSIPKGTLLAIFITFLSYELLALFVGFSCVSCAGENCPEDRVTKHYLDEIESNETLSLPTGGLLFNKLIMKNMSLWAPLVYVGVFAATLSSALASLVGAPRILQSVAADKLFPFACMDYFAQGVGANNEPHRAYVLTFGINCAFVLIGKLDVIAPLISNFFMLSYAFTNYACFASSSTHAPGWRPSFKYYNKWLSCFGACLCFVVMFLIDWITAFVTFVLPLSIFMYLKQPDPDVNWGAAGEAAKYVRALQYMEKLQSSDKIHVKTFRPQFLVMTGLPSKREWLVKFTSLLQKGRGILVCGDVVLPGDCIQSKDCNKGMINSNLIQPTENFNENEQLIHNETATELACEHDIALIRRNRGDAYLQDRSVWNSRCSGAFCEAVVANSLLEGFQILMQTSGIGKMRPNTVVLGFKHMNNKISLRDIGDYEKMIRTALSSHFGVMVVRDDNKLLDLNMVSRKVYSQDIMKFFEKKNAAKSDPAADSESFNAQAIENSTAIKSSTIDISDQSMVQLRECSKKIDLKKIVPTTLPGSRIDVWWIADDGGLTMLIPHLLSQSSAFHSHRLRALTISTVNGDIAMKLQRRELRMVHLLNKFRIKADTQGVPVDNDDPITEEMISQFEKSGIKYKELNQQEKLKTDYNMRLTKLIRKESHDASIVFITLPIPDTGIRVSLFTAWLHMLSDDMPPTVLMRGNNENVLTFFC